MGSLTDRQGTSPCQMPATAPLDHVRVLVAHRDARLRREARRLLEQVGAEVAEAAERTEAAEAVRQAHPHVVLLDHGLDGEQRSLMRDVAGDPELLGTAVVLMHPDADVPAIADALSAGAVDVWGSELVAPELIARVRVAYRSRQLLELALQRNADLEELAYRDELTELPNRRGTVRQLEVLLSRSRRHGHPLALLMIDADRFKRVNDDHGHAVGDAVLRELSARLRERVRREDVVGRWGGEEFVIALPETAPDGAAAVAEALRAGVGATPMVVDGVALDVTVSIGVAAWTGQELTELVTHADRALYAAKTAGRNRVVADAALRAA
jgi:two-component system cell cycle response regulator